MVIPYLIVAPMRYVGILMIFNVGSATVPTIFWHDGLKPAGTVARPTGWFLNAQ